MRRYRKPVLFVVGLTSWLLKGYRGSYWDNGPWDQK
jgi:hypothetical protein